MNSVAFKAQCASRDETRLFTLPKNGLSFKALSSHLADLFGTSDLHVQYLDNENDLIVVKTDEELVTAVQFFSGKPSVRLIVSSSTKGVAPQVAEATSENAYQDKTEPTLDEPQPATPVKTEAEHAQPQGSPSREEEKNKHRESCKTRRSELHMAMGPALKQLEEMGFTKKGLCVRLLVKFDGDVQKVAEEMRAWQQAYNLRKEQKHGQKKELKRWEKEEKRAVKQQLREEKEKYKCEKRALKTALKEENQQKKKEKHVREQRGNGAHCHRMSNEEVAQLEPKLKQLEEMGFNRRYQAIRLLKKHDGDVGKVASILTQKREDRLQRCAKKGPKQEKWKALEDKHKDALTALAGRGFTHKRLNIRLLERNNNDMEKVVALLTIIEEKMKKKGTHRREMA